MSPLDFHGGGTDNWCKAIVAGQPGDHCPQPATRYISVPSLHTGMVVDGEFMPAEQSTHACEEHEQQVAAEGRLLSSRELAWGRCDNCREWLPRTTLAWVSIVDPACGPDDSPDSRRLLCVDFHACQVRAGGIEADDAPAVTS